MEPIYFCQNCGTSVTVVPSGSGFPPRVARQKLEKICAAKKCECKPMYRAGFQ